MSMKVVKASPEHAHMVAAALRQADQDEWQVQAAHCQGMSILECITTGLLRGEAWYAGDRHGQPVGIFGCVNYGSYGAPWLMCTTLIARHGASAVKFGRNFARRWACEYPILINMVHKDHVAAIKYINAVGYTVHGAKGDSMLFTMQGGYYV